MGAHTTWKLLELISKPRRENLITTLLTDAVMLTGGKQSGNFSWPAGAHTSDIKNNLVSFWVCKFKFASISKTLTIHCQHNALQGGLENLQQVKGMPMGNSILYLDYIVRISASIDKLNIVSEVKVSTQLLLLILNGQKLLCLHFQINTCEL